MCTGEARGEIIWWIRVWRLKGVRRSNEQEICPRCSKEDDWSHILRCEGTEIWRDQILGERFRKIRAEIGTCMRMIIGCMNKRQCQKINIYIIKHKDKWERIVRKKKREV
jgi:hypothetical protein